MDKKVIRERHSSWYDKRNTFDIANSISSYVADSLRGCLLWLSNCQDESEKNKVVSDFSKAVTQDIRDKFYKEGMSEKDFLTSLLKKMIYSFKEVSNDHPEDPWNIWWEKNYSDKDLELSNENELIFTNDKTNKCPDEVMEAEKKYYTIVQEGIGLYADLVSYISDMAALKYRIYLMSKNKKPRMRQLKKLDSNLVRIGIIEDDQAIFIHDGLKRFRKKLYGYPMGLTEEKWNEYLDNMIFSFDQIATHEYIGKDKGDKSYWEKYDKGKKLFAKYFESLWD